MNSDNLICKNIFIKGIMYVIIFSSIYSIFSKIDCSGCDFCTREDFKNEIKNGTDLNISFWSKGRPTIADPYTTNYLVRLVSSGK